MVGEAHEALWLCTDTGRRSCSWAGRTREAWRAGKEAPLLPPQHWICHNMKSPLCQPSELFFVTLKVSVKWHFGCLLNLTGLCSCVCGSPDICVSVPTIQYVPTIKPVLKKQTNTTQIFRAYSQKITSSFAWHRLQDRKMMVVHLSLPIVVFYKEIAVLPSWRPSIITDNLPHSSRSFFNLVMAFMKVLGCAHTKPTTAKKLERGFLGWLCCCFGPFVGAVASEQEGCAFASHPGASCVEFPGVNPSAGVRWFVCARFGPECNPTSGSSKPAALSAGEVLIQKWIGGWFVVLHWWQITKKHFCQLAERHRHLRSLWLDHGRFRQKSMGNNVFATLSNLLSPHALRVALLAFPSEQKLGVDKVFFCTHTTHEKLEMSVFWSFDSSSSFFKSSGGNKNTSTMSLHYFSGLSFFFPLEAHISPL